MNEAHIRSIGLILALSGALTGVAAVTANRPGSPGIEQRQEIGQGSVTATVMHSETLRPLEGMPVTVYRVDISDPARMKQVVTNKFGVAVIIGLENGVYEAVVLFNNHTSNFEVFTINGDNTTAAVKLYFNPDIDG